jgi:aspartokinase-like uncharacterized kinase
MIVVKVGGSLFEHPRLGPGLRAYLKSLEPNEVMLVPGGGDLADAVRKFDRVHGLGDEISHAIALRAMTVSAEFLVRLLDLPTIGSRIHIPDCCAFTEEDQSQPESLPFSWDVTSDSIAARMAVVLGAERLILLKSVDIPPGTPWTEAAERGWVDRHFPKVIAGAATTVETMNFCRFLDSFLG